MPELVRIDGMIIVMLFKDTMHHNKPHVHVYYGEYEASFGLDGECLAGRLPGKRYRKAREWILSHEKELREAWSYAVWGERFDHIRFI